MNTLLFIGGVPRLGTTLVKRLLNSHDYIYCEPEFSNLEAILNICTTTKKAIGNERKMEGYMCSLKINSSNINKNF